AAPAAAGDEVYLVTAAPETKAARAAVEVRLEGLSRHYGPVVALDHLDLTLAPGELIALLGPSGCGKTTTLRLLAGLEDADTGQITVGGRDITHVSAAKRDMGMVFQAYSLFPHMTVRQNVAFGLRLRKVSAAQRDKRAIEMLDLVGLSTQADRYPHQLSGGQQQRVALARALAIEPLVRPEAVSLASRAPDSASGPLAGTVIAITFLGATSRVTVDLGDTRVMAQLPTSEASALSAGSRVVLAVRPDPVLVSADSHPAALAAVEDA